MRDPRLYASMAAGALGAAILVAPSDARAHIQLEYPPSWIVESSLGDPQVGGPCGVEPGQAYTATHAVTTFAPGQTITVKWIETVAHDGWFRIALSYNDRNDLLDPPVTVVGGLSTDAGIENPPVAPVLVDGLFPHRAATVTANMPYSYDLTLPTTPCTKCTLQVIQFMSGHGDNIPDGSPVGFFYHHCADISIQAGSDAGASPSSDGGEGGSSTSSGGSTQSGSTDVGSTTAAGSSGGSGASASTGVHRGSEPSTAPSSSSGGCAIGAIGASRAASSLASPLLAGLMIAPLVARRRATRRARKG